MRIDSKKLLFLICLGSILEYYDFAVFIYLAPIIGKSLIPVQNPLVNLILSYAIFAIGAFFRPLGGMVFAHVGDTKGRKHTFVYTILLMAIPTFLIAFILKTLPSFISDVCLFVSFKTNIVRTTAISETILAIINGKESLIPTVKDVTAGPKTKPKPNAAPRIAKPLPLFFSSVVSEITADITGMLPAVIPSSARAKNKKIALGANAIVKNDTADPASEIARSGFLPYLSDSLPIIGVAISWHSENKEKRSPF